MKGALGIDHLSLKRLCGEGLEWVRAASLGTLEDVIRKALDTGISLYRGPFKCEGNLESGGAAHISGTLKDE